MNTREFLLKGVKKDSHVEYNGLGQTCAALADEKVSLSFDIVVYFRLAVTTAAVI